MKTWDEAVTAGLVQRDVELAGLTTYKFGGAASLYAEVGSTGHLAAVVSVLRESPQKVLVVGRGSNLVVSDAGFDGLVVRLAGTFLDIDLLDDGSLLAGGAVPLPRLARAAVKQGRGGLEFFVGVPGSVGGAVRMNAGCHGTETRDVLVHASIIDVTTAEVRTADPEQLEMAYRHSNLTDTDLVTAARFRTSPVDAEVGERRMRDITAWRKESQPGGTFNAGSVFKNPDGDAAGRIIDSLGLKGFRVGGVAVSDRHANFFVADEGASAQDVYDLVAAVRRRVRDETGVDLEPEIKFAGFFSSEDVP